MGPGLKISRNGNSQELRVKQGGRAVKGVCGRRDWGRGGTRQVFVKSRKGSFWGQTQRLPRKEQGAELMALDGWSPRCGLTGYLQHPLPQDTGIFL